MVYFLTGGFTMAKIYIAMPKLKGRKVVYVSFYKPRKHYYDKSGEINFSFGFWPFMVLFPHELPNEIKIDYGQVKEFDLKEI